MFQMNPRQSIHMTNQALFSSKGKSKKLKCRLLQFLFGTLRSKITKEQQSDYGLLLKISFIV